MIIKRKRKKTITIRLYQDDITSLTHFADGKGVSVSAVIRQLVHHSIKNRTLPKIF